jgi:hypothetical protein
MDTVRAALDSLEQVVVAVVVDVAPRDTVRVGVGTRTSPAGSRRGVHLLRDFSKRPVAVVAIQRCPRPVVARKQVGI